MASRLSVCLCVRRPSVTLRYRDHIG